MKVNWKKNLFKGLCLTSVAFVFQACYGTPQDFGQDVLIEGKVVSKNSNLPAKGIKITIEDGPQYVHTDNEGNFGFYTMQRDNLKLTFEDIDSTENRQFIKKDTLLRITDEKVMVNIMLDEKE